MAINLNFLKRLVAEDFSRQDQQLVSKIGGILNPALEAITAALNRGMSLDDLNVQTKQLTVQVDAGGYPINEASFRSTLSTRANSIVVGRAQNTSSNAGLISAPFVSFDENNGLLTITQVLGLPANTKWLLTLVVA